MGINNINKIPCVKCNSQAFMEVRRSRYNISMAGVVTHVTVPRIMCLKCHMIYETPYAGVPPTITDTGIHMIANRYPLPSLLMRQPIEGMGDKFWP